MTIRNSWIRRFVTVMLVGAAVRGNAQVDAKPGSGAEAKPLTWDVVSVKPVGACASESGGVQYMPDGIRAFCAPMLFVLEMAYGIREPSRIVGAPDWVKGAASYDIDAKVSGEDAAAFAKLSWAEKVRMLRPVLADRFRMRARLETREMPVYELEVAKGGPKLKEATADEAEKGMIGPRGRGRIEAIGWSIGGLPSLLNAEVGRPVVDKTGLTGKYDFTLEYTPGMGAKSDAAGPSVFTAVQEQLGLKLEPAKAPIEVLVIDSMERPAEN